jgi:hypothetical protein
MHNFGRFCIRVKNRFPKLFALCPHDGMAHDSPDTSSLSANAKVHDPDLSGSIFDFTPVSLNRCRHDGWSAEVQRRFIAALVAMGPVRAKPKFPGSRSLARGA